MEIKQEVPEPQVMPNEPVQSTIDDEAMFSSVNSCGSDSSDNGGVISGGNAPRAKRHRHSHHIINGHLSGTELVFYLTANWHII